MPSKSGKTICSLAKCAGEIKVSAVRCKTCNAIFHMACYMAHRKMPGKCEEKTGSKLLQAPTNEG